MKIAHRVADIQPFHVMALLARARSLQEQGYDVIHLEVGEPDFDTPAPIVAAGVEALHRGKTHYTPATGLPILREVIAEYYSERFGVDVSPQRIVVTTGASGALSLVTAALFNPTDRVMLADPGYPCNSHFLRLIGARSQWVATDAEARFQLSAAAAVEHWRDDTAGILVATPSNPTGTLLSLAELHDLHEVVRERGGVLIVDEIYQGLTYGVESCTALSLPRAEQDIVVINSFSKYFGMTGWRLGWIVAPQDLVPALDKLAQNFYLAPPTPSQYAALAAFTPSTLAILDERRNELHKRRDYLLKALPALGFKIPVIPEGAFYLYCDISELGDDSFALCEALLEQAHVAVTPGKDFGFRDAARYLRIAYTAPIPRLQEAVARIARHLKVSV
ncbi:aminotransferase class-I [gamma proteobacterium HdN1]|nr:aminotransferase class-I [gamma proteobacterium HdN1]